jgi:hypothetical protein
LFYNWHMSFRCCNILYFKLKVGVGKHVSWGRVMFAFCIIFFFYVSCIRITQIANKPEAINELRFELESSQFKYGPLVSFRVIETPIRDAPNDPMYHQTVIAFAQFKYTISNYLAIKDYHNILFHEYHLQFQKAGETNWQINSEIVIRREYFSKIMQGIPYRHADPYSLNHDTPPPAANTQHENVAVQTDMPLATNAQPVNVIEQVDPPIVTNATATPTLIAVENLLTKRPLNAASQTDIYGVDSDLMVVQTNPCRSDGTCQPPISRFLDHFNSGLMKVIDKAAGEPIDNEEILRHRQASRCIYCFQVRPHDKSHPYEIGRHQSECSKLNRGLTVESVNHLIQAVRFIKEASVRTPLERMMKWECAVCMSTPIEHTSPNKDGKVCKFAALYCGHIFCSTCIHKMINNIDTVLHHTDMIYRDIQENDKHELEYFQRVIVQSHTAKLFFKRKYIQL